MRLTWFGAGLKSSEVHGRVFNYELLAPYTTVGGAWVFVIRDRTKVDAWVDGLLESPRLGRSRMGPIPHLGGDKT